MTLQEIRTQAGLSRNKAARALQAAPVMLYRWEKGLTVPTMGYCLKMSELYDVPLEVIAHAVT